MRHLFKENINRLRDDQAIQIIFLLFGFIFISIFTLSEWDGFVAFSEFISNAIQSIPNFIEKVFTYFQDLPRQQLERSMLVGAIVGAVSTALVYLSAKDFLKLPTFDTGAVLISIFTGIFIYYSPINPPILNTLVLAGLVFGLSAYAFNEMDALSLSPPYTIPRALWVSLLALAFSLAINPSFWNCFGIIILISFLVSLLYSRELRSFFTPHTVKRLANPQALSTLAIGLALGAIVGAISGQILNYPLKHCTFIPDIDQRQYRMGLGITAISTLVLLVPAWTLLTKRFSTRAEETVGFFRSRWIPYLLLLPSLLFLSVFLYYPAIQILTQSTLRLRRGNPRQIEYCLQNYLDLSESKTYQTSFSATLWITVAIVIITMVLALGIATLASQKVRGASIYRTLLIWPYAVSPVVMGTIFLNMFRKGDIGIINYTLGKLFNTQPDWFADASLAPWVIVFAAVWNGLGFNILFYIAGLQNIPQDLLEAASIDGANRIQRFLRITLPLLSPFTFFLLVANVTYSFYGIYGIIDILTKGGPAIGPAGRDGYATSVLIYEAYREAFRPDARLGEAAAQAVVLFLLVAGITLIQFRYVERRVTYGG